MDDCCNWRNEALQAFENHDARLDEIALEYESQVFVKETEVSVLKEVIKDIREYQGLVLSIMHKKFPDPQERVDSLDENE